MLRKSFYETVHSSGMDKIMQKSGTVIAAFSGGADSSVLVALLAGYAAENGIRLVLAHVNHMIRGEEADEDERFSRSVAEKMGLEIHVKRADVSALAKETGDGIEEAARKVRYAFFEELSEEYGGAPVATAHNSDDNLETVLFHLMRGSGLKGLCGIDPVRDGKYIRPLITCSARDIRIYCERQGILYRIDSTNTDTAYARNYIRHRIIPEMAALSPSLCDSACRMTELLRSDSDYMEREAERLCPKGTATYDRAELNALHPAIASRILRRMYVNCVGAEGNGPEYTHMKAMLAFSASERTEGSIPLPGNADFHVTRKAVFFTPASMEKIPSVDEDFRFSMSLDGSVFENERYKIIVSPKEHTVCTQDEENIYKLSIHKIMCSAKIIGTLYMKYRNQGDTYRYGGFTRKVKKLMIDKKLTADEKRLLPLLCDDNGILWMPGWPLRDGAADDITDGETIHLYFFEKE